MGESTKIEWCDHTFNPWIGCSKVHAGCDHCYAEAAFDTRRGIADWGPKGSRFLTSDGNWMTPLKWNRAAECIKSFDCNAGSHSDACPQSRRPRVFCASLADVFEDWPATNPVLGMKRDVMRRCLRCKKSYPKNNKVCDQCGDSSYSVDLRLSDVRQDLFALIDATQNLDWLLLTKRPENIRSMWRTPAWSPCMDGSGIVSHDFVGERCRRCDGGFRKNVWLGTSISDQSSADKQIPELLKCRDLAPVLFLSIEPLLGPIEFSDVTRRSDAVTQLGKKALDGINWVIVGGESGPNARPMYAKWARKIRNQCLAAGVPFFFKQWGEFVPIEDIPDELMYEAIQESMTSGMKDTDNVRVGKKAAGRLLDGREWSEFPREPIPF